MKLNGWLQPDYRMSFLTRQRISETEIGQITNSLTCRLADLLTPRLDVQVLLSHITRKSRAWILAHPEYKLSTDQQNRLSEAILQLEDGIPLPYILGHWEFYKLDFEISPVVLIPRPETELLVETAIHWLRNHPNSRSVADIGTGSGCIAISLAVNIPEIHITAVDISEAALAIARANASTHNVADRITFVEADLLNLRQPPFDVIVANLPYIPTRTLQQLDIFGREPITALDGGLDGLNLIRKLIQDAPKYLTSGGLLLIEIEANQGKNALKLAQEYFQDSEIALHPDLAGYDRLLQIHK
jgi:release factor glutamine methyltransferase